MTPNQGGLMRMLSALPAQIKGKNNEGSDRDCSCQGKRDKAIKKLEIRALGLVLFAMSATGALGFGATHT